VIAAFYERAGLVRLRDNGTGSVTIGGTVSPAGGNFDEPVTKSTLKVVGAFHGLSRERSDARKYPAIHPLESWSKYPGLIDKAGTEYARDILFRGNEVNQMMKVVGEEGTSLEDYELFLKSDFIDSVYLQQDSYDPVDSAVSPERQRHVFRLVFSVLVSRFDFGGKEVARGFFNQLRQKFLDYNGAEWQSGEFARLEGEIAALLKARQTGTDEAGCGILLTLAAENKGKPA
jgi:V/A-type H+-transporting ATPase subunit A